MTPQLSPNTLEARTRLAALGARYHRAGWLMGTSGNLSARVVSEDVGDDRIVVSASGRDKGELGPEDFVELDLRGELLAAGDPGHGRRARPSAEASIHLALYRTRPTARVALHVHTVASTLALPDGEIAASPRSHSPDEHVFTGVQRLRFTGLELIKGWDLWEEGAIADLPYFRNWPHVPDIARDVERFYHHHPDDRVPALLIAHHGITAWGADFFSANRHLEVTEFLCQVSLARRALR